MRITQSPCRALENDLVNTQRDTNHTNLAHFLLLLGAFSWDPSITH